MKSDRKARCLPASNLLLQYEKNMPKLYKKLLYRPVPDGATIIAVKDGKKYAVWKAVGREKTAKYIETENGPRIVEESQVYVARYTDASGRFRERSTGCRDLRAAEHKLNGWLQEVDRVKVGIVSQDELDVSQRMQGDIASYFHDFELHLKSKMVTPRHISETIWSIWTRMYSCVGSRNRQPAAWVPELEIPTGSR